MSRYSLHFADETLEARLWDEALAFCTLLGNAKSMNKPGRAR